MQQLFQHFIENTFVKTTGMQNSRSRECHVASFFIAFSFMETTLLLSIMLKEKKTSAKLYAICWAFSYKENGVVVLIGIT